jgi:colicin import membrane protein
MKKKKNYIYFAAPLVGLLVFTGIYVKYSDSHQARVEASAAAMRKAREDKIVQENILKKKAVEDALAAQEVRKKAKADKEARDLEERDRRERAALAMANARDTATRKLAEVKRLEKQLDDTKREIEKLEQEKKAHMDEQVFIRQYVQKAEANQKALAVVLQKIEAADQAAAEAARAAAAAAAAAAKKK